MNKYLKHTLFLLAVSVLAFVGHKIIGSILAFEGRWANTGYSLESFYLLGFISSLIIGITLFFINKSMPKNMGFAFLVLVSLKVLTFYIYISKGLHQFQDNFIQYNLIVVFFVFLFYDVFVAFRVLNEKVGGR